MRATHSCRDGAILIDTRPEWQRRADGDIPGAVVIERNHLEWRCDPACPSRVPEATGHDVAWIICCDEGYSSSLAAASLQALGLCNATDLAGGFRAWRAAGLPVATPGQPSPPRLPPASMTLIDFDAPRYCELALRQSGSACWACAEGWQSLLVRKVGTLRP